MTELDESNLTLLDALIIDILNDLNLDERVSIAKLNENEIRTLKLVPGKYLNFRIEQLSEQGNNKLLKECKGRSGDESLDDAGPSVYILRELWKRLRKTHRKRVVK